MKLLICSLTALIIGCNSTTYECVEVWGKVGIIQDGCLVKPLPDVQIEFSPMDSQGMANGKFVFCDAQSVVSDSLGRWILTLRPGEYSVRFTENMGDTVYIEDIMRRFYNNRQNTPVYHITVPDQSKWEFTIE